MQASFHGDCTKFRIFTVITGFSSNSQRPFLTFLQASRRSGSPFQSYLLHSQGQSGVGDARCQDRKLSSVYASKRHAQLQERASLSIFSQVLLILPVASSADVLVLIPDGPNQASTKGAQ